MATILALILSAALVVAAPNPDPQPTTEPTPPQPTTTSSPGGAKALAEHVPSTLRPSCEPTTDALPTGATAQLDCTFEANGVPDTAFYVQFQDAASMTAFAERMSGTEPLDNDACKSVSDLQGGGKEQYSVDNKPRGTVWCYRNDDKHAVLLWTDDDLNIGVVAIESDDTQFQAFLDWYKTAGPIKA